MSCGHCHVTWRMHLFFLNVQWHQQISLKIESIWAIDQHVRNAKVSKTMASRRFIWALFQSSLYDAASLTLCCPSSFPKRTPFGPLWVLYRIWSSWLGFQSCPLKHERGGKQERRSEEAGLKEMKVVYFLKTQVCRWMAVDFWRMVTVGTPNIAESHLRPVMIWAIICSLLFREYSSSEGGFCLNSVMFPQSKSKDHLCENIVEDLKASPTPSESPKWSPGRFPGQKMLFGHRWVSSRIYFLRKGYKHLKENHWDH